MRLFSLSFFAAFLLVAGCQTQPIKSFKDGGEVTEISPYEKRLWLQSKRFDKAIYKQNSIYQDDEATQYLQDIMDSLFPEFQGKIRVKIVKTPVLNAFALPNGSVYIHLGMLARFDNEAQLATLLGHEGAHFIHKHGYKQRENIKTSSAFAMGLAIAGVPVIGNVIAMSSISGFSQEHERESDKVAYQRVLQKGYDTRETSKGFEYLLAEVKALDIESPYFFSTHPKLQDRIDTFNDLNAKNGNKGGIVNKEVYDAKMKKIRTDCLKSDIQLNRYKSVILVLEKQGAIEKYGSTAHYYLGEAYRLRAEKGDLEKAGKEYQKVIQKQPGFAAGYKAMGLYHMKSSQHEQALEYFNEYLRMANDQGDAGYVKGYIEQIKKLAGQS